MNEIADETEKEEKDEALPARWKWTIAWMFIKISSFVLSLVFNVCLLSCILASVCVRALCVNQCGMAFYVEVTSLKN